MAFTLYFYFMIKPLYIIGVFLFFGNFSFLTAQNIDSIIHHNDSVFLNRIHIMDKITVEPNPYYSANDFKLIKEKELSILNLPSNPTTIDIYTLNGVLVKQFKKTGGESTVTWDFKNQKEEKISSGLYLVSILVQDIGEKVVKIYVVMPLTMSSF